MNTPPPSRTLLWRLVLVVLAAVMLVIFSYGWTVTDIDLAVPQEAQRQENVGNALRELLSPNVFSQEYEVKTATTSFLINCPADFTAPEAVPSADQPYIVVEPGCGTANEPVTVRGFNFAANGLARVNWIALDGERRIRQVIGTGEDNFSINAEGSFSVQVEVPRIRGTAGETHTVEVQGRFPLGLPTLSTTTGLVLEKMVETIFLALIATAVSILPSAILSFFAAQNLMRPVRTSLGGLLLTVALFPVGWWIGSTLLTQLGMLALNIGRGNFSGSAAATLFVFVGMVATTRKLGTGSTLETVSQPRALLNAVLIALGSVVIIGLVGGLGLLFGGLFTEGIPGYLSAFIGSLGGMVELVMPLIAGVIGAFTLSSIGTTLTRDVFKRLSATTSHLFGGVLGALAGAVVLGATAVIGMSAAWMGLLTPFVAGGLASVILPQLYQRFINPPQPGVMPNRPLLTLLNWIGTVIGFVATFLLLNVRQALVEGTLPDPVIGFAGMGIALPVYVLQAMLIGAVIGAVAGALAGTRGNFPIGTVLYSTTRTVLNALRSIEPLIMGLVFVIWVGIGPFAGVLALTLHSIASLGKLYSEQIESIDTGPIEALQSTGANRLQTIMYAVVPQIIPPYIAFTMYRWDINVRMSTIIGFVGGGGIGFLLQQQINLLRYRDAGVAVLAIAIVVSILDYASAAIRERYT